MVLSVLPSPQYAHQVSENDPPRVRGTVIGMRRKGVDSSFTILNHVDDDAFEATFPLYSPLLRAVRVLRRRHVTGGRKRVRRAKLYYLWDEPPTQYRVTRDTKEGWEEELEVRIRRELQVRGRSWSKKAVQEEKDRLLRTGKGVLNLGQEDKADEYAFAAGAIRAEEEAQQQRQKAAKKPKAA